MAEQKMYKAVFDATGITHYLDNFESIAEENEDFNLSNASLIKEYEDGDIIYKCDYDSYNSLSLVPEPTNEYDPNAIKICCNGLTLGYIKKEETDRVRALMAEGTPYNVVITGGECKEIDDGKIIEKDEPLEVTVFFKDNSQIATQDQKKGGFKVLLRILGIALIIMSILLLIAVPVAGIIGIIIGVIILITSKKY